MSKAGMSMDNLDWAIKLGCSPSACTNSVKEILNRGINSYIWDAISSKIYPVNDVIESRKNILLHYLRNQVSVSSIQYMKNTKRLQAERKILCSHIERKQSECTKTDVLLQQNGLRLAKVKSLKKATEIKKIILELKCQETKAGINVFEEMFLVCQRLLPSFEIDIDETIMHQSLALAGAISSRADKREALKKLSENLGSVAISRLWTWILNKRIQDTEKLVNHEFHHKLLSTSKNECGQHLNIGIAQACGQHTVCTISKLVHLKKGDEERIRGINYMEKIENLLTDDTNEAIHDWLTLAVEVAQLEKNQRVIQSEMEILKRVTEEADLLQTRHLQLASEIHDINEHMEQCVNKIQQAFIKFEPAGQSLLVLKNQLTMALNMIAGVYSHSNPEWLNNNLSPEIEVFQENLNINALNKILLSGKVGAYRHMTTCMSNALIVSPGLTSSLPVYRAPLYHLVNCFENLMANSLLISEKVESTVTGQLEKDLRIICAPSTRENDTLELIYESNSACEKCQIEINNFDAIYDSWVYQTVNEVMSIYEDTVHGATYNEWLQRYTTLAYMMHRNK